MSEVVKNRGAQGQGSIVFKQNLEYPREPGQITYYPPEPSDKMKKQVKKDKAGGLAVYIIGFVIVLMGYLGARDFSEDIDTYAILIPLLLILGLTFAIMYMFMDNESLAKLSRTMPTILMVCLLLFYITSIIISIRDLSELGNNASESAVSDAFKNLIDSLLNPAFFLMSAGLMISLAGGTMLLKSTKFMEQFIPGMIIIENPAIVQHSVVKMPQAHEAPQEQAKLCQHCGKPLEYIEQYKRYYCYDCQQYAPADL